MASYHFNLVSDDIKEPSILFKTSSMNKLQSEAFCLMGEIIKGIGLGGNKVKHLELHVTDIAGVVLFQIDLTMKPASEVGTKLRL